MARVYDGIDEHQQRWIARQALFFVGTAPLAADGHVNVSPKAMPSSTGPPLTSGFVQARLTLCSLMLNIRVR